MDLTFNKIQDLLMTKDSTNISLALEIAKGQGISEQEVWAPWMELIELCRTWPDESLEAILERVLREDLQLTESNLDKLPIQLKKLHALEHLNVSNNHLTQIPSWIKNLKKLTSFTAKNNSIKSLPTNFTALSQLQILNLEQNALSTLPEEFGSLKNLKELCLHHNPLEYIPDSLGQLKKLELLDLPACAILAIPDSIQQLKQLKEIYINDYSSFLKNTSDSIRNKNTQKINQLRRILPRCLVTF